MKILELLWNTQFYTCRSYNRAPLNATLNQSNFFSFLTPYIYKGPPIYDIRHQSSFLLGRESGNRVQKRNPILRFSSTSFLSFGASCAGLETAALDSWTATEGTGYGDRKDDFI